MAAHVVTEAWNLRRIGRLDEAYHLLLGVVSQRTGVADAYILLAQIDLDRRQWSSARDWGHAALSIRNPSAAAWSAFARANKELGDMAIAFACYRRALTIEPLNPAILTSLGTALCAVGKREQARRTYQQALQAYPNHTGARASLDALLKPAPGGMARLAQIREEAQRQHRLGNLTKAFELHHEALRVAPQFAGIWLSAGLLAHEMGQQPSSLPLFEEAARLDPKLLPAIEAARRICVGAGLSEKAVLYSNQANALRPSDDIRFALILTTPAIQPTTDSIKAARLAFDGALDDAIVAKLRAQDPYAAHGMGAFFLAYHGENDRPLQIKVAQLLSEATSSMSMTAAHCSMPTRRTGKVRVGFISAFFFNHSIGKTTRGLVTELCRDTFEVSVLRITPSQSDEVTALISRTAARVVALDPNYLVARTQIAALELDILFFQDIGMEPTSYFLALSRLAPVQCVSFGHPDTTGIPNMDYFVSNDLYEPDDAATYYSENLYLLKDLPTLAYYYRPDAPADSSSRTGYGLQDHDNVYICPQTLFKLHPEFDEILDGILRNDPDGVLVLISGQYEEYSNQIRKRFSRSLGDVAERVLFLDPMSFPRFLNLLLIADVCLDTLHFNGMNSSLEAFSVGTPIVTLPGRFQRGRHTYAMYRKMCISECIASDPEEYIEIAVRLGRDKEYSSAIRRRILQRNHVLYEDHRVVTEFERFFLHAVRKARPECDWPAISRPNERLEP